MHEHIVSHKSHEMATAHVIIKCKSDSEKQVIENLEKIQGIKSIHRIIGGFDVLVKVEAIDNESLRRIIRWKIINSDNIESVTTLMCVRKPLCVVVK